MPDIKLSTYISQEDLRAALDQANANVVDAGVVEVVLDGGTVETVGQPDSNEYDGGTP